MSKHGYPDDLMDKTNLDDKTERAIFKALGNNAKVNITRFSLLDLSRIAVPQSQAIRDFLDRFYFIFHTDTGYCPKCQNIVHANIRNSGWLMCPECEKCFTNENWPPKPIYYNIKPEHIPQLISNAAWTYVADGLPDDGRLCDITMRWGENYGWEVRQCYRMGEDSGEWEYEDGDGCLIDESPTHLLEIIAWKYASPTPEPYIEIDTSEKCPRCNSEKILTIPALTEGEMKMCATCALIIDTDAEPAEGKK